MTMIFRSRVFFVLIAVGVVLGVGYAVFAGVTGGNAGKFAAIAPAAGEAGPVQPGASGPTPATTLQKVANWTVRCGEKKEGDTAPPHCEIFQRLVSKDSGQRVTEFAVGYPDGPGAGRDARGVIVLPLGVVVDEGMDMQIDEGQKFKFRVRYCMAKGCLAFLNLNDNLLSALSGGREALITGKAFNGQDVNIRLSLDGFGEALKKIQQGS
jgi:invasion protein IalB